MFMDNFVNFFFKGGKVLFNRVICSTASLVDLGDISDKVLFKEF